MKRIVFIAALFFWAKVFAGSEIGTVRFEIGQHESSANSAGKTFFYLEGQQKYNSPACATYVGGERWVINNDWPAAELQNSILLSAAISGKRVQIYGSGSCEVWGDTETALSIHIVD